MDFTRRGFLHLGLGAVTLGLGACTNEPTSVEQDADTVEDTVEETTEEAVEEPEVDPRAFRKLTIDSSAWKYDEENDVYYQLGIPYCLHPAATSYESLAIFVPGAYLSASAEDENVLEVAADAHVGAYSAATAPILMPINSGTFGAQTSPTAYSFEGLQPYLGAGYIYVYAGFRGRSSGYESREGRRGDVYSGGVPWPVIDLKAAVRFLRYNREALPGDTDRIITFGFSGAGGISAVMGASGDAEAFMPYLTEIGAATHDATGEHLTDATFASATWCPITSLDAADASYEWMMGQYAVDGTRREGTWTHLLSADLARSFAAYVNDMGLTTPDGTPLTLEQSDEGIFCAGSYYDYLMTTIQESATTFFSTTEFPYTYAPTHLVSAVFPGDPNLLRTGAGTSDIEQITGDASAVAAGMSADREDDAESSTQSMTFETDLDYVNHLNRDIWWLTYNQRRTSAFITSIADFSRQVKGAAKDVCAFDAIGRSSVENQLFGVDDATSLHFSKMVADCLVAGREAYAACEDFEEVLVTDWTGDLTELDSMGQDMQTRRDMFDPLHFLCPAREGFESSGVAPHWRINSGVFQTDTSLTTEVNLTLALTANEHVKRVDFTPVWGQGHVLAEATGTAEENLLAWIADICASE